MHIELALELGCEPLIYTAFVELCNKHEDNAWDASYRAALACLSFRTPKKTLTIIVFRLSLLFKIGVDCGTVLDV